MDTRLVSKSTNVILVDSHVVIVIVIVIGHFQNGPPMVLCDDVIFMVNNMDVYDVFMVVELMYDEIILLEPS